MPSVLVPLEWLGGVEARFVFIIAVDTTYRGSTQHDDEKDSHPRCSHPTLTLSGHCGEHVLSCVLACRLVEIMIQVPRFLVSLLCWQSKEKNTPSV